MALKHPIKTTTNTTTTQDAGFAPLQLPAPQTFDILPPLHELLARVDAYHNQGLPPTDSALEPGRGDDVVGAAYAEIQPLDPKDFPTAALDIKSRIRRALRELEKLPDMDRSVEEQGDEIRELELRIRRQREMLRRLGSTAEAVKRRVE